MEELFTYLNGIHEMSSELINYLALHLKTKQLAKKNFLLKIGHVSKDICFITKGMFRCFYLVKDKEVSSWFMKEGDVIISMESFFKQTISYEAIQAMEDSTVHYITQDELQFAYRNFPEFNFTGRILLEKYYTLSEERLHSLRLRNAMDRYIFIRRHHADLEQRVPSKYLASYLGITEVRLSGIKRAANKFL
jgi:CRP-like cAMP-binding protein